MLRALRKATGLSLFGMLSIDEVKLELVILDLIGDPYENALQTVFQDDFLLNITISYVP